ncbi:hypothetical protein BGW36DRAFT_136114 [Talaromyces proteolyticus]|uniref:Uncharacterized protein n=1 Tax=Talaromyces proteolyticus TaxID=1131652 RepID=A0AAD4Q2X3_9EURO|nr:uncharacterized protein BGW36DRAFT_136114 [Talaromyces proteolyticus]KAH8700793.1 hypothetical protein BGW36DRAFT_136114 [Talaromyces proteolyticus]
MASAGPLLLLPSRATIFQSGRPRHQTTEYDCRRHPTSSDLRFLRSLPNFVSNSQTHRLRAEPFFLQVPFILFSVGGVSFSSSLLLEARDNSLFAFRPVFQRNVLKHSDSFLVSHAARGELSLARRPITLGRSYGLESNEREFKQHAYDTIPFSWS